jgi:flagellin
LGIFINTNVSSLKSQRHLQGTERTLKTSFERLSTGVRVNSAKDDAAGLSIINRMEAQTREMGRAVHNANDAVSLLQTTEGVLNESTSILQRMRALTVQAGNETNNPSDRAAIQAELKQLLSELDRSGQAQFNGRTLFGERYEFFLGSDESADFALTTRPLSSDRLGHHSEVTSATHVNAHIPLQEGELSILTRDGVSVPIFESTEEDDELSTANRAGSAIAKASAINRSTHLHGVTAYVGETTFEGSGITRERELGPDDVLWINGEAITGFTVSEHDVDGKLQEAINAVYESTGVIARRSESGDLTLVAPDGRNIAIETTGKADRLGFGNGFVKGATLTLSSADPFTLQFANDEVNFETLGHIADLPPTPAVGPVFGPGPEVVIDEVGTYDFFSQQFVPGDLDPDLDGLLYDGSIPGNVTISGFYDATLGGENRKVMLHTNLGEELSLSLLDEDDEVVALYHAVEGQFDGDGIYTFLGVNPQFAGPSLLGDDSVIKVSLQNTALIDTGDNFFGMSAMSFRISGGSLGEGLPGVQVPSQALIGEGFDATLASVDVSTSAGASRALNMIDLALEELSATRAHLGAKINRLESTMSNLTQTKANLTNAQSRIQDADYALESVNLAKRQITQQAGVSILAQANTVAQVATALLTQSLG